MPTKSGPNPIGAVRVRSKQMFYCVNCLYPGLGGAGGGFHDSPKAMAKLRLRLRRRKPPAGPSEPPPGLPKPLPEPTRGLPTRGLVPTNDPMSQLNINLIRTYFSSFFDLAPGF